MPSAGARTRCALAVLAAAALCGTARASDTGCQADRVVPTPAELPAPAASPDWAALGFYREANAALPAPAAAPPRVVFIGDSITASWPLDTVGAQAELINRGIGGQVSAQILLRFCQDVVSLRPAVVHIMAGINDVAQNAGPTTLAATESNLALMVQLAQAQHIAVVLASVTPALEIPWRQGLAPAPKIGELNDWLRRYAQRHGLVYADYYGTLTDGQGGMRAGLSEDGLHPNLAGYALMRPLARRAVAEAARRVQR